MAANPTPYEMPCPVADYYDPDDGPTATLAEEPPDAVLSVASSLMEAEIDTSFCASCGAPIGFVLVEVRDRYESGAERVTWVTPWLVVDRSGAPAAVCEDCSEDEAPPNPPPTGETTMNEPITTDDYRVRTWPARNLLGRRGWKYQVDYLGAWDVDGDQPLNRRPKWFADRVTATEAGIDLAIYVNGRSGEGVPIRVWLGDDMVEQGTIDRIYMEG